MTDAAENVPRLYLSHSVELDYLSALEFGRANDGQPSENWAGVSESFGFLLDAPEGRFVGFNVLGFSDFDPEGPDLDLLWDGPRFDVPVLGMSSAPAGEIVLGARAFFTGKPSINRYFFERALEADGEQALKLWNACLQSGDPMAHFALGYTLYALERYHEAYFHLRHYVSIAPNSSWNWCWLGKGAEAVGEIDEAIRAYERALELEQGGGDATEAEELLARIVGERLHASD